MQRNRERVLAYKKQYRLNQHAKNGTYCNAAKKVIDEMEKDGPVDDMVIIDKLASMGLL